MSNLIKIIGTGKSKYMPEGQVFHEPSDMAELLVNSGRAVYEEKEKVQVAPEKKKEVKATPKLKK
jgi:hypothetical protein